jgi:pilus assembly protein CpaC
MYKLVVVFVLFGAVDCGFGQEAATSPVPPSPSKIEHVLKAAEHLEAAGLTEDAKRVHALTANIPALEAEIERQHALGVHAPQVLMKLRVMELSRTKLQKIGYSFDRIGSVPSGLNDASLENNTAKDANLSNVVLNGNSANSAYSNVFDSTDPALKVLDALRKDHLAKILAEPTLVTLSNRMASFCTGNRSRVAIPNGDGLVSVENKPYGILMDLLPVVVDDQTIHLTCRIELSQLDLVHCITVAGETVPVLDMQQADTTGDFKSGQTILLGGLRQHRNVASAQAASNPSAETTAKAASEGSPKATECDEEIETLFLLTPEIVPPILSEKITETQTRQ